MTGCLKNRERAIFQRGTSPLPRPTTRQDDTGSGGWAGERAGTGFLKQSLTGWRRDGGDLILAVRLTPGATREDVGGRWTDEHGAHWLSARVRAVPEKGKANAALIALLAKRLDWPRGAILLESGDTNRLKRLRIQGGAQALDRLTAIIETWIDAT